jgi:hypothetical protein
MSSWLVRLSARFSSLIGNLIRNHKLFLEIIRKFPKRKSNTKLEALPTTSADTNKIAMPIGFRSPSDFRLLELNVNRGEFHGSLGLGR